MRCTRATSGPRRPLGRAAAAALLAVLASGGCLTRALWDLHDDDAVPELHLENGLLEVIAVRPVATEAAEPAQLDVEFRALPDRHGAMPATVRRFDAERPGRIHLEQRRPHPAAASAAGWFDGEMWFLRLFDADYMRAGLHVARVTRTGSLDPARLGARLVPPAAVPRWWHDVMPRDDAPFALTTARALRGFDAQDWRALLAPDRPVGDRGAIPVAWIDADGAPIATEELEARLRSAAAREQTHGVRLLARFDDPVVGPDWIAVPLPLLLDAEDLRLRRDADTIRFLRHERWDARLVTDGRPQPDTAAFDLPLGSSLVAYSYAREGSRDAPLLLTATQYALTPVTAALDLLEMTNPVLVGLRRWLFGDDEETRRWLRREMKRAVRK